MRPQRVGEGVEGPAPSQPVEVGAGRFGR
jgi:hypothetical protein